VQAAPAQAWGAQSVMAPGAQVPAPSHLDVPTKVAVAGRQAAAAQIVPAGYFAQCPAPSQEPFVPQLALPMSGHMLAGTIVPVARGVQVPALPLTLHDAQVPQAGLAQQTPSVHMLLRHSPPATQVVPSGLRFVQTPDWQVYPVTHSVSFVQVVRQAVPPHWKCPGQLTGVCAQLPLPSQAPTGVLMAAVQLAAPQLVPTLVLRQAPAPLQVPSNPQGGAAVQR
jgi:hypothetical protein